MSLAHCALANTWIHSHARTPIMGISTFRKFAELKAIYTFASERGADCVLAVVLAGDREDQGPLFPLVRPCAEYREARQRASADPVASHAYQRRSLWRISAIRSLLSFGVYCALAPLRCRAS
eukprot:6182786-Pleurochrysis_carterae.AAC.4